MKDEWGAAVWIGSAHPFDLREAYLDFRAPRVRGRAGDAVEMVIAVDSRYRLWLNGRFVNRGPARSYPHAQAYDRLDLSDYWRTGDNVIAVQVYQPGYSHFAYVHRAAAGMVASVIVNGEPRCVSDAGWRARRNASFYGGVPRVSIYGSGVESRTLDRADDWVQPDYDAAGWDRARVVAPADGHLWSGLHERVTPLLVEREVEARLVECRLAEDDFMFDAQHESLSDAWVYSTPFACAPDDGGWFRPFLALGTTALWLFDLGRAYTCQGQVAVRGASGGETIYISYADKMVDGELVLSDPQTYCRVRLTDSFDLRAGDQLVEPFHMRGGRYVLFQLSGDIGRNIALRPSIRVAEYALEISQPLFTDDPRLAAISAMCENTMRACLQDSFVDCVWREASQWVGDGLVQAKTLAAMCDDYRPMRKLLRDSAAGAYPDGFLPGVAVSETHAYTIPRYSLMWVELLAFDHEMTGDAAFARAMWPTLTRLLDAVGQSRNGDGLLVTPPGRRHYIDWSPTAQSDPHAVYNLHGVLALRTAARLAAEVGESAEPHQTRAHQLQQTCRAAFYEDGIWWDDLDRSTYSQLAAALAFRVGAVAAAEQGALLDAIVARSLDPSDAHEAGKMVLASPFMHHYVFEALTAAGRNQAVIDIIQRRWGRWADAGEPTTWENWSIDFPDGSACHAFAAHPRYHLMRALQQLSQQPDG